MFPAGAQRSTIQDAKLKDAAPNQQRARTKVSILLQFKDLVDVLYFSDIAVTTLVS